MLLMDFFLIISIILMIVNSITLLKESYLPILNKKMVIATMRIL